MTTLYAKAKLRRFDETPVIYRTIGSTNSYTRLYSRAQTQVADSKQESVDTIENILERVNPSGRWATLMFFQLFIPLVITTALVYQESYLLAGGMQHRCIDGDEAVVSNGTWARVGSSEQCEGCTTFEYRSDHYESTMVESFDLVCSRRTLVPTYKSMFLLGYFVGPPVWGWASDTFGRRPVLILLAPLCLLMAFAQTQATEFWMMLVSRALFGFFRAGYWKTAFILNVEFAPEERRNWTNILIELCWPIGGALCALFGYFMRDWRTLHAYTLIPALISIPFAFLMPESPRWMITTGRYKQAIKALSRAANFSGGDPTAVPDEQTLQRIHDAHRQKIGATSGKERSVYMQLLSSPVLRTRTLKLVVLWNMVLVAFFGLFYYSTGGVGGGSPYLSLILSSFFRVIVYYPLILCLNRFGKRPIIFTTLSMVTILMGCLAALPSEDEYIIWGVWIQVVAIAFADMALNTTYAMTSELYPTVTRQTGISLCSAGARFGSFTAPYAADLLGAYWGPLPALVFGGCAFIGALDVFLLPETNKQHLPDTIDDVERKSALSLK